MLGVVSLLHGADERAVRDLWAELAADYGLGEAPRRVPFPHVSYQIAADYDRVRLEEALAREAVRHAPIRVTLTGLGAFAAPEPVLYLAVERNAALDALHAALWQSLVAGDVARQWSPLYAPGSWVPHITLAQLDLTLEGLRAIQSAWSGRDLRREVWLSDLALGGDPPGQQPEPDQLGQQPLMRVALGGVMGADG
ncbi:MAG TPA: 2'-5' RNA ligase family protein [Ktedonobacterales bacterium]|nr:2'-5' RNA ligase family protein [Ktedonobacterales bacterium]